MVEKELDIIKGVMILFLIIGIIAVAIILSISNMADVNLLTTTRILPISESILADNATATSLSQTPSAWTSATSKNKTWLDFDGVNDYVDINSGNKLSVSNASLSFWVNSSENSALETLIILNDNLNNTIGINKGNLSFSVYNSSLITTTFGTTINNSKWINIVLVRTNNGSNFLNFSFYINGVSNVSKFINATSKNYNGFIIGSSSTSGAKQSLDEFRYYNRTLAEAEISEIYNSGRRANKSLSIVELIGWFPINENSGTDIHSINESLISTTYSSAISGATWNDNEIDVTIPTTSYTQTGDTFTIDNINYAWKGIDVSYDYTIIFNDAKSISGNVSSGLGTFFESTGTIFAILAVVVIISAIAIIIVVTKRFGSEGL